MVWFLGPKHLECYVCAVVKISNVVFRGAVSSSVMNSSDVSEKLTINYLRKMSLLALEFVGGVFSQKNVRIKSDPEVRFKLQKTVQ